MLPGLAVFPKGYVEALSVDRSITLFQWIDLASQLGAQGLELHPAFFLSLNKSYVAAVNRAMRDAGLRAPMFCGSPDLTNPDPARRQAETDKCVRMLDVVAQLGGQVFTIQLGPCYLGSSKSQSMGWFIDACRMILPQAVERGIALAVENHVRDRRWKEAGALDSTDELMHVLNQVDLPGIGVNFDPANAVAAGEDPAELLEKVKTKVVSIHARGRDVHGGIDYDSLMAKLCQVGFDGWVSVEDGDRGIEALREAVALVRHKLDQHFGQSAVAVSS